MSSEVESCKSNAVLNRLTAKFWFHKASHKLSAEKNRYDASHNSGCQVLYHLIGKTIDISYFAVL